MVGFELPPAGGVCPACRVANSVLAFEDHRKRVFRCLRCRHLWHHSLTPAADPSGLAPRVVIKAVKRPAVR
jgi:Zn ribbon nucleic-acid-binding protein